MPSTISPITVFSKPACQACKATKKQLDKVGVDYTTIDITEDPEAYEYVQSLGYKSAPVVEAYKHVKAHK